MAKDKKPTSATFNWKGTDKKGNKTEGSLKADTPEQAKAKLFAQGIIVSEIKKESTLFKKKPKITPKDIAVLSRQLATMMGAGVPLVQAFDIIGRGHENPKMQEMILSIKADIENGTSVADALKKHPEHFDTLFVNLVRAGESAGILDNLLDKIATYKEKTESIKGKVKKAMVYPAAVIGVAVIITAIIMIFVVPQFKEMFASFGAELPAFTQLVVAISEIVAAYWWLIGFALFGAVYLFMRARKSSTEFRYKTDQIFFKIPVIGNVLDKAALARFSRTTATMFAAGVPLVEALQSVAGATGTSIYEKIVLDMREEVATGQSLQNAMSQHKRFPHLMNQMVAIGEESGALDTMLGKVADFYEEEVDNTVDALSSLLEPLIMVVIGTIVGGLVIALYLPIFQMGKVVGG